MISRTRYLALAVGLGLVPWLCAARPAQAGNAGHELERTAPSARTDGARAFRHAYELHHSGRHEAAARAWSQALDAGYRRATTMYNLACAQARLGHAAEAIAWLERSIDAGFDGGRYLERDDDLDSLRADPAFRRLLREHGSGETERALRRLERLEAAASDDGEALYDLAMDLHQLGRHDEAARAWGHAARLGYREQASVYNIACAQARAGRTAEALRSLERAVELGFGGVHALEHDDDLASLRAEPAYRQLVGRLEELELPAGSWGERASRWLGIDIWSEAVKRYEAYLARDASSGRAWFNLGFAALRTDDPDKAARAFQRAFDLGYRKPVTAYNLACAHARGERKDEAFRWLEQARELGFDAEWHLSEDPDLDTLRGDPRFPEVRSPVRKLIERVIGGG